MTMSNMASSPTTGLRYLRWVFVVCVGLLSKLHCGDAYSPRIEVTCKSMVDLENMGYDAGLLVSRLPDRIPIYANEEERCDIYVSIPINWELMFYFDWLDMYAGDLARCDTTSLQLFDGSPNQPVTGLDRHICGHEDEMPRNMYFVYKHFFILRINALSAIMGSGFRIHFTRYRRALPCSTEEFTCDTFGSARCISVHLVCDQWNDCGDWLDEERDCPDLTPGAIAGLIVAIIIIVLVVIGLIIFCHIRKRRERQRVEKLEYASRESSSGVGRGLMSPFTVSGESIEKKESYQPRYNSKGRSSNRGGRESTPDPDAYEDFPPPYTENPPPPSEDSRSEEPLDSDEDAPRVRRKNKRESKRETAGDSVFDDKEDLPRVRRPKSQDERTPSKSDLDRSRESRDERPPPRAEPELYPTREDPDRSRESERNPPREERYPSRDDRYPPRRDEDDLYPPRDDRGRYPSRRDDDDRYPPRDDRYPSRRDNRDDDRRPPGDDRNSRRDDRYPPRDDRYPPRDDRYPSRRDDRDSRDRDRLPSGRKSDPRMSDDPSGSDVEPRDQLHPLRQSVRRSRQSLHSSDSGSDTPVRDEKRPSPGDRDRDDDRARRGRDDKHPTTPTSRRDDRSGDRDDDPRSNPPSARYVPPPQVPPLQDSVTGDDEDDEDAPRRRRRRRSRSREGQDRQRSTRAADTEDPGRRNKSNMPPGVNIDIGYKEEAV